MQLTDVDTPCIAIVAIKSQCEAKEQMPGMHLPYYQVSITPGTSDGTSNGFSPSQAFYRFGQQGDELLGWQPAHEIEIYEILAEYENGEFKRLEEQPVTDLPWQTEKEAIVA